MSSAHLQPSNIDLLHPLQVLRRHHPCAPLPALAYLTPQLQAFPKREFDAMRVHRPLESVDCGLYQEIHSRESQLICMRLWRSWTWAELDDDGAGQSTSNRPRVLSFDRRFALSVRDRA